MSSEVSLMETSALFDSKEPFLESSLSDWSESLFCSVIVVNVHKPVNFMFLTKGE